MKLSVEPTIFAGEQWNCPNCDSTVLTSYCPACGECPLRANDLTLRGLVGQVVQSCTNIDGPLLRSFRDLIRRPGVLTTAYLQGQRKPYTLPLQLFLVANVLFFAMQSLTGAKIFSTPLDQHLRSDIWGSAAQQLITHRLDARHTTLAIYTPVFNQAVALNAKSLASYDCVLVATDHARFDYELIRKHAKLIVDSRGKYLEPAPNIVKA